MNELILEIMKLALEKNSRKKNTIFVDFSGHVEWLEIMVFEQGWKADGRPNFKVRVDLNEETAKKELQSIIEYLKQI